MTPRMDSPERVQAAVSRPAYFELDRSTWDERVARAVNTLADCGACPPDCGVNRLKPAQPNANLVPTGERFGVADRPWVTP
jgi:uncharacterized Fe-S radical SAM superfamily protein PflX